MKKGAILLFLLLFVTVSAFAQQKIIDSLKIELNKTGEDTNRVLLLGDLSINYYLFRPDTAILYAQQGYDISQKLHYAKGIALSLNRIAGAYNTFGDYAKSLIFLNKAFQISQQAGDIEGVFRGYNNIGDNYATRKDYKNALEYFKKAQSLTNNPEIGAHGKTVILLNVGDCYLWLKQYDSADAYLRHTYIQAEEQHFEDTYGNLERDLGLVEAARKNNAAALSYFQKSIVSSQAVGDIQYLSTTYASMADFYKEQGQRDSAIAYAKKALQAAQASSFSLGVLEASKSLADYYAGYDDKEAFRYLSLATAARDSIFSQEKVKQILSISFEQKQRQQELDAARLESRNQIRLYALLGILAVFLLLALMLYRNNRQKQKANKLLQRQKEEIEAQRDQTNKVLEALQQAQKQLIQSEKMASLGELTAGIAHEIQNPLNFVNNFSETNVELLDEATEELKTGNQQETLAILFDVKENEQKIKHHGRRAESIVKGMLEHSRTSKGEKQPTNLNALTDEYLRLAYHGIRAKDKNFNAILETSFDESVGKVNIVPQDIGRVLLNLFNNGFYAVNERKQELNGTFEPTVQVTTARQNGSVVLKVADNGNGIPQNILDKIFQPFFTTKPTGQGTGLGLSLSYDIIKAHNGELKVESKEGEGSEFIVVLPV